MATVPKAAAVASAAPAQNVRTVNTSTRVASVPGSQIDALDAGTNISFDAAASGFEENKNHTQLNRDGSRRQQYSDPGFDRLFTADSQVFAKIFQDQEKVQDFDPKKKEPVRLTDRPISSVIKTYESNALTISGQAPIKGVEFSFNL